MIAVFDKDQRLVKVTITMEGPLGKISVDGALDTGCSQTLISAGALLTVGYDLEMSPSRFRMTTASGMVYVPRLSAMKSSAIDSDFPVVGHTLPPTSSARALLGFDFFRGRKVCVDFQLGQLSLT